MPTGGFASPGRRPRRPLAPARRALLRVEALEDRLAPANNFQLPDLQILSSYLSGWTVNPTAAGGREIRYATALANGGQGAFDLRATSTIITNPDGTQQQVVNQRMYRADGTFSDQMAGTFTYHPNHGHVHFDDMAWGQLRVRTAGNGVGDVVAIGPKTSFCLIDINRFNPSLPGSPASPVYASCNSQFQGISVGWNDVYGSTLDGQSIDVTGVPNGDYWLEVVADPMSRIDETNETNNATRIPITLSTLPAAGFRVLTATPVGASLNPVGAVELNFNEPVDPATFTAADVAFTGPAGAAAVTVTALSTVKFRVAFATQTAIGTYTMTVGPDIRSAAGRPFDQNNNGAGGEPADLYINIFTIPAPRVAAVSPAGATAPPVGSVRVTYNKPMNAATFTRAALASFTGPGGVDLLPQVTTITPVSPGGSSSAFDIAFAPQTATGAYILVIEPTVLDTSGNPVDQNGDGQSTPADRFTATFGIAPPGTVGPDAFGYDGSAAAPLALELVGQPGTFAVTFTTTDDGAAAVDLGTNRFTFYGQTYTGNNQLFVSTNGLISFGQPDTSYANDDLGSLTVPAIAVLWDDWVRGDVTPQVLGKFDDTDGDGTTDRLVIQWNQVHHFSSSPTSGVTFQAILQLNTGPTPGAVVLNYPDLVSGDAFANGASATVGMRAGGATGARLLVSLNGSNSLVGNSKAVQARVPTVASVTRLGSNPAPAGDVEYLVTFSHPVTGVDATDFVLAATGNITGAVVDHVHATADPRTFQVHVLTGTGSGTLRLDVRDDDSILTTLGAKLGGPGAGTGAFSRGQSYTVVQPPPRVLGATVGDGTAQRSKVRGMHIVFDRPVVFAGDPAAAFHIKGVTVAVDLSQSTPTSTVARLTFSSPKMDPGSLADGSYTLRVLGGLVSTGGVNLDGDGDGTPGGDLLVRFHRLFGDADGDRDVDATDEARFQSTYGLTSVSPNFLPAFDWDGDGDVDKSDRNQFYRRFGRTLPP